MMKMEKDGSRMLYGSEYLSTRIKVRSVEGGGVYTNNGEKGDENEDERERDPWRVSSLSRRPFQIRIMTAVTV